MSRPKYKITASDLPFVHAYLLRAMEDSHYITRGNSVSYQFRQYLGRIDLDDDLEHEAEILNRWCEKYLTTEQWNRLKVSIRKMRYRQSNTDITITLKPRAHKVLQTLIDQGKARSLSEAVLWLNDNKYNS
ncbi:hypothetical protein [Alkalimarinus coralli]|uniref:hypothetical protein n=1 Tax=Alkalimarinus coralli TaxID=2935863 RepID=UPI00202B6654|nr:hypothetical protein [Alkalimarinus coralli]